MNTTTAVEQSANFGLRTLPGLFGLQNEAFERLQKLTHLNLAAFETMMEEGQSALSPQQSGLPPVAGGRAGVPRVPGAADGAAAVRARA